MLDDADLVGGVGFILDAVGDELELAGVVFLVGLGAVFHGQEEFVGQGLHHQRDFRLFRRLGERRNRQRGGGASQYGDSKKTSCEWQLHGFTPIL
ncbi:hypothetical protein D9M73_178480 [compost metagenome]